MRGVIVEGDLYGHIGADAEPVRVFVELDEGYLYVRRAYGGRASTLTLNLDAVEAALAALKTEAQRRPPDPIPGQIDLNLNAEDTA